MKADLVQNLRDALHRRELSPAEEQRLAAWLAQHPEALPGWREDAALAHSLRRLPPVPVPSNFTARVLAEVKRDLHRQAPPSRLWSAWRTPRRWGWMPAGFAIALSALALAGWQWRSSRQQAEYIRNLAPLRALASMPPEVLQDFDAIRRFGDGSAPVDFELLSALQ